MQEEGYIAKLLFPEGAKDVKLGSVVAIIVDSKDDVSKFKDFKEGAAAAAETPAPAKKEAAPAPAAKAEAPKQAAQQAAAPSGSRLFVSPLAKKIAETNGLDLSGVSGTGPNNRIIKSDVEAALQAAKQAPTKAASP